MSGLLRLYTLDECGKDGYPLAWSRCPRCNGTGWVCDGCGGPFEGANDCCHLAGSGCPDCWVPGGGCGGEGSIKAVVRAAAGHRCVRCGHPYRSGEHGNGEWSPCDTQCTHRGPVRWQSAMRPEDGWHLRDDDLRVSDVELKLLGHEIEAVEARWRILTVHHLGGPGRKFDCRWHQLIAACQRCHLEIQGKVNMEQMFPFEHTPWFKVYAAGHYAAKYEDREITREEAEARMDELLAYERMA